MKNEGMEILNALIKEHGKEKAEAMASRFFEGVKTGTIKSCAADRAFAKELEKAVSMI